MMICKSVRTDWLQALILRFFIEFMNGSGGVRRVIYFSKHLLFPISGFLFQADPSGANEKLH